MSGVEIRQKAAWEGQKGGRRGQVGWPAPLYATSWTTALRFSLFDIQQLSHKS